MSRVSMAPSQRNLTLTEELEKIEQSITLTLQEIDHNFSRAHRIVTSSILPVVEQYAEHSRNVWEGTKFWKQFFEASANVSLNGYEETATDEDGGTALTEDTEVQASSSTYTSPPHANADFSTPESTRYADYTSTETPSDFPSPDFSTPKAQTKYESEYSIASHASPYEKLRREVQGSNNAMEEDTVQPMVPTTPRAQTFPEEVAESSPFEPPSTTRSKTPAQDVLLHRVLDKNYRIQATPHAQPRLPRPGTVTRNIRTPATARKGYTRTIDLDSSPLEEAPQLHLEDYRSPAKTKRTPGISVLTPGKPSAKKPAAIDKDITRGVTTSVGWDSDSDEDDGLPEGMSPPKTMQFHIPQSKLLQTPAQEASKRIVEDLLATAGGNTTEEFDDSPSVIRHGNPLEEDTF